MGYSGMREIASVGMEELKRIGRGLGSGRCVLEGCEFALCVG